MHTPQHTTTDRGARRLRDESGAISMMAAALAFAMLLAGSLAVDVGRVAYVSRDQQGATDLAALDATRALRQAPWAPGAGTDAAYAIALEAAQQSLGQNVGSSRDGGTSHDRVIARFAIGYLDETGTMHVQRSSDGVVDPLAQDRRPTEVIVETAAFVDFVLGIGDADGGRQVLKKALAAGSGPLTGNPPPPGGCPAGDPSCSPTVVNGSVATITVASRLAEFSSDDQSVIAGEVLDELLDPDGTNEPVTVTAAGWDGLATSTIQLRDLVDAGLVLGTTEQVLDSQINVADLIEVLIAGLSASDPDAAAEARTALQDFLVPVDGTLTFRLGDLFAVTTEDTDQFLDASFNVLDLLSGALQAANRDNLGAVSVAGGPLDAIGLQGYTADVTTIELPQSATGPAEQLDGAWATTASTSQVDVALSLQVTNLSALFGDDLGAIVADALGIVDDVVDPVDDLLCGGPLQPACDVVEDQPVDVSLVVSAARGTADLVDIQCAGPDGDVAVPQVSSGVVTVTLGGAPLPLPVGAFTETVLPALLSPFGVGLGTAEATTQDIACTEVVLLPPDTPVIGD